MNCINVISLGAGVQSSTMALMAACGELTPMPRAAIFADTMAEPESVYRWLKWLEKQLPFPVIRASAGNLALKALRVKKSKKGNLYTQHSVPAFITDGKKTGLLMRQCTGDFKLNVIHREIRKLIGRKRVAHAFQWIGISLDEAHRMKPSRKRWLTSVWPLIEKRMTRQDCLAWMKHKGYPAPPRSACVFCPFHSDKEWLRLKTQEPKEFHKAVVWERAYQKSLSKVTIIRGVPFLHRSCKPLSECSFVKDDKQPDLFGNECEGMCGV